MQRARCRPAIHVAHKADGSLDFLAECMLFGHIGLSAWVARTDDDPGLAIFGDRRCRGNARQLSGDETLACFSR